MKTEILHVRLTKHEFKIIRKLAQSETIGFDNLSEYIRFLLHREHSKRTRIKTQPSDYQTIFRLGTPSKPVTPNPDTPVSH
jgi:Arc/MetJ-type ribon-helix-helix transcriptional regulator